MRTRRLHSLSIVVFCAMLVASSATASAQRHAPDCKAEDQLVLYLQRYHQAPGVVLAFDHLTRSWSGYRWDGVQDLKPLEDDLEIKTPFTNKPRVFLAKEDIDRLEVFVVNTNPLLFSTRDVDNTVANIEELADLQKLTGLLGGFLASAVGGLAPELVPPPAPAPQPAEVEAFILFEEMSEDLKEVREERIDEDSADYDRLVALHGAAAEIIEKLKKPTEDLQGALKALEVPHSSLEREVQLMREAGAEIRNYVQLVESGKPDGIEPRNFAGLPNFPVTIDASFRDLATRRPVLAGVAPVCPGTLTALRETIRLYRLPLPGARVDRREVLDQFQDNQEELGKLTGCPFGLDVPISKIRDHMARTGPSTNGTGSIEDAILRPLLRSIEFYLVHVDKQQQALKAAADLLAKSGDTAKIAGAVQDLLNRRQHHLLVPSNTCSLRAGVLRVDRVKGLGAKLGLTNFGTDGFQIISDSPFKDSVSFYHAEPSGSFEMQRAWKWDFDVDVATYYTEIVDPVFKAVDPDGAGSRTDKVITLTDEDSRAGDLAMFLGLQWRPRKVARSLISIGPQIGLGLNADHPAIFGGFGVGIGQYIKLGFGWTWQEVKELRPGQELGVTVVADDAAIKTRDGYEEDYYISLSITLDDLPFFKAP